MTAQATRRVPCFQFKCYPNHFEQMNKNDLLALFARCPQNSQLFGVVEEAVRRLNQSSVVRVVSGEQQSCEELLRIYTARLRRKKERNAQVPGLEETVQMFSKCHGWLKGGYAETDADPIYFWSDETGNLAGCVFQN